MATKIPENLKLYEAVRKCPNDALKTIRGGRLNGMSDINPIWRIKMLTTQFGVCGFGWYYEITRQWIEQGAGGEQSAFVNINLYVKMGDEWSKPIQGTGGSAFVASEKNGLRTSDECYKMALTDAISVACKALGFAADVYWQSDRTKYGSATEPVQEQTPPRPTQKPGFSEKCEVCGGDIVSTEKASAEKIIEQAMKAFGKKVCIQCGKKLKEARSKAIEVPEELQPEAGERAEKSIRSDVL